MKQLKDLENTIRDAQREVLEEKRD